MLLGGRQLVMRKSGVSPACYEEVGDVANKCARKLRGNWSQWNLSSMLLHHFNHQSHVFSVNRILYHISCTWLLLPCHRQVILNLFSPAGRGTEWETRLAPQFRTIISTFKLTLYKCTKNSYTFTADSTTGRDGISGCCYGHPSSIFIHHPSSIHHSHMWYLCTWRRNFNETWHKYSVCEWALLKRFKVTG